MADYIVSFKKANGGNLSTIPDGRPIAFAVSAGRPYHKAEYMKPVVERVAAECPNSPLLLMLFDEVQGRSLNIKGQWQDYHPSAEQEDSLSNELGHQLGAKFLAEEWSQISPEVWNRIKILRCGDMYKLPFYPTAKAILDIHYADTSGPVRQEIDKVATDYLHNNQDYVSKDEQTSIALSADFQLRELAAEVAVIHENPGLLVFYNGGKQNPVMKFINNGGVEGISDCCRERLFVSVRLYEKLPDGSRGERVTFSNSAVPDLSPVKTDLTPTRPMMSPPKQSEMAPDIKALLGRIS